MRARLEKLIAEYGKVAFVTYFTLFILVFAGAYIALRFGFELDSMAGTATGLGAAYAAAQLTKPLRIGATVLLTPIIARLWNKHRGLPKAAAEGEPTAPPPDPAA